jgi:hypothetical protein
VPNFPTLFVDLTQLASFAVDIDQPVQRVIDPGGRVTGPLYPEVSIDEDGNDQLVITQHPVEQGAVISDHAYKVPSEIRMRLGWSNAFGGYSGFVQQIYQQLLNMQTQRIPFSLWTGKRQYDSMLIESIRPHTDHRTEYVLLADVIFKQVILVSTQPIAGGAVSSSNPPAVANPASNTPTQQAGAVYPVPATYPGSIFGSATTTSTGETTGSPSAGP